MKKISRNFIFWIALVCIFAVNVNAQEKKYEANWESLDTRPLPDWYQDAKFGIFIHWGVYSVPAWAPEGMYAEWYWNWMGGVKPIEERDSETWEYHVKTYGEDFEYHDFAPMFKAQVFEPEQWAELFKDAGAQYVVLTSKHHDGYCLWPSREANISWGRDWNSIDVGPKRDLLGDLGEAVRDAGLKMGFYYSLYEWYNPLYLLDKEAFVEQHMIPQFKDVVTNYQPSIIFSDGEWDHPADFWKSEELLAWLFNETDIKDEVVVNDRWGKETRHEHGDYYTTEYAAGMDTGDHPWEENRGMGHSYGFNRNEELEDYRTSRELTLILIDMVSRGGNLLLNVGPKGDGTIPVIMQQRLRDMGQWLKVNGEAIYGTRPWKVSNQWTEGDLPTVEYGGQHMVKYEINEVVGEPEEGKAVVTAFFTKKEDTVYAISPRWPDESLELNNMKLGENSEITLLGHDGLLEWEEDGDGIRIMMPDVTILDQYAWTFKITGVEE